MKNIYTVIIEDDKHGFFHVKIVEQVGPDAEHQINLKAEVLQEAALGIGDVLLRNEALRRRGAEAAGALLFKRGVQ